MEVEPGWRKSSKSDNGGNCVEVGQSARAVLVRDTKSSGGPVLRFSAGAWERFTASVKRPARGAE